MKTMKNFKKILPFVLSACFILTAAFVQADVEQPSTYQLFGVSAGYNNVFFGDYYGRNGDIEGHAAIKGNLDVQSYSFGGWQEDKHTEGPVLVVGGNATVSSTTVHDGDAYVGGKMQQHTGTGLWNTLGVKAHTNPENFKTEPGYVSTPGNIYVQDGSNFSQYNHADYQQTFADAGITSLPFDFAVAESQLRTVSSELWSMSDTTSGVFDERGNYVVDLTGATGLQVVTIDAEIFNQLSENGKNLFLYGGDDTTLVVNMTNDTGLESLRLREIYINGNNDVFTGEFDGSNVLFNVGDLGEITISGANINGSFLALDTDFDVQHGHFSGQVFGASATTTVGGEFHAYYTFDDQHFSEGGGNSSATPEPSTMLMFGAGLGALALVRRLRKNK